MVKPVKIDLKRYMRNTGDIDGYYVDVEKLSNVGVVILQRNPQVDINLTIDGCVIALVNETATIAMLHNYMTLTDGDRQNGENSND